MVTVTLVSLKQQQPPPSSQQQAKDTDSLPDDQPLKNRPKVAVQVNLKDLAFKKT